MLSNYHLLLRLTAILLLAVYIDAVGGLPLDTHQAAGKRENDTNMLELFKRHKPSGIPLDLLENYKNSTRIQKQESNATIINDPYKQKENLEKENFKFNIDEEVLFQIFRDDNYYTGNKTLHSTSDEIDFTTEDSTSIKNCSGDDNPDDRFGGGLAAQHAAVTLIGG